MKVRKGNDRLSEFAKSASEKKDTSFIPISSIAIKPWIEELIRPRTESEQANLQADIEANGLNTPVTLTTIDGEENCLIDGHGRVKCYQNLGKNSIPFVVVEFNDKEEIKTWIFRRQLGRRNLSKQDRAYIIGSLQESKAEVARQLEIGTTKVAEARSYFKAINWLVENEKGFKEELLQNSISSTIQLYKKLFSSVPCTESVQVKKHVNWKLDPGLVSRLKEFAKANDAESISQQVEKIIREYLDSNAR